MTQCQVWPPCPGWLHSRVQHQARGAAEWQSCHGVQLLKPTIITTLDNLVLWCFNVCSFVYCHNQLIPLPCSVYCSNILCNILIKHEKIHVMIYLKHNSIHHKRNIDLKNLIYYHLLVLCIIFLLNQFKPLCLRTVEPARL